MERYTAHLKGALTLEILDDDTNTGGVRGAKRGMDGRSRSHGATDTGGVNVTTRLTSAQTQLRIYVITVQISGVSNRLVG